MSPAKSESVNPITGDGGDGYVKEHELEIGSSFQVSEDSFSGCQVRCEGSVIVAADY